MLRVPERCNLSSCDALNFSFHIFQTLFSQSLSSPLTCFVPSSHSDSHQVHKSLAVGIIFLFLQHLSFIIPHLSKGLEALPAVNTNFNNVYFLLSLQFSFSSMPSFFFFSFFNFSFQPLKFHLFFSCSIFSRKESVFSFRLSQSSAWQTAIISCNTHTSTHVFLVTKYLTAFQMMGEVFAFNKWKKPATVDFIQLICPSLIKGSHPTPRPRNLAATYLN